MRLILTIAALVLVSKAATACPPDVEDGRWTYAPTMWDWLPRTSTIPARPSFYGTVAPNGVNDLPVFTRRDGSVIPHSAPRRVAKNVYRVDLAIDEGDVFVQSRRANFAPTQFVIDPSFVPRTRNKTVETDLIGTWLRLDSDAVALRTERADGTIEIETNSSPVVLAEDKVRITALYGDGREEVIFARPSFSRSSDQRGSTVALLLAALAVSAALARRQSRNAAV
jgi:hypothetical protein